MAENNLSALLQLIVDKAQARTALQKELKELQKEAQLEADIKINLSDVKKAKNEFEQTSSSAKKFLTDVQRLTKVNSMKQWADNNSKAVKKYGDDINRIINRFKELDVAMDSVESDKLTAEWKKLQSTARETGNIGMTAFDKLKKAWEKFGGWSLATGALTKTFFEIKQGIKNVKELDDALTNISYTMDVSSNQLEKIGNASLDMAKNLHTSASTVLDAVKTYANANETAESILNKARATIMMSNVSGMGTEQTVDIIQGTVEQFDLSDTEEQLMHISDVLQTVSANMPMDFAKGLKELSEGIQTSGQTAKMAGYDLESYTALLGTLISKTRQSGSELGRSLRTMMLRTTKASTTALASGEVTEDDLSNAEKALRRVGIEVRSDIDTFKDFDQIIAELYGKLDTLSDVDMSNLAYELAGIRQSNVFKMMIASYGEYLDMADKANNADGITLTNQEKYAESLTGKLTELGAIWEKIGDDAVSSDLLKGLTDAGIGISSLIEKIGLLNTAIAGAGIIGITKFVKSFA